MVDFLAVVDSAAVDGKRPVVIRSSVVVSTSVNFVVTTGSVVEACVVEEIWVVCTRVVDTSVGREVVPSGVVEGKIMVVNWGSVVLAASVPSIVTVVLVTAVDSYVVDGTVVVCDLVVDAWVVAASEVVNGRIVVVPRGFVVVNFSWSSVVTTGSMVEVRVVEETVV